MDIPEDIQEENTESAPAEITTPESPPIDINEEQIKKATKGVSKVTINKCFTTLYANKERLLIDEDELTEIMKQNYH